MASDQPIHVILVPGADALEFGPDVAEAGLRGVSVHPLVLTPYSGHPIDGRRAYYDDAARQIENAIADIRRLEDNALVFAIGRNQGASILGYAAAGKPDFCGLIFTGAIPELSIYRAESDLPSAVGFRASLTDPKDLARIPEMRDMDLTETLKRIPPESCLLQIGSEDDWMDKASFDAFRELEKTYRVDWIDDGHAMISAEALEGRWAFIEQTSTSVGNG